MLLVLGKLSVGILTYMKRKPRKNEGTQKFGSLIWPWGKFLVQSSRILFTSGCI